MMLQETEPLFTPAQYKNPKDLYKEELLSDMTHAYLSQENYNRTARRSKERRQNIRFYPSSLGSTDRDIVLSMLGYPGKKKTGLSLMVMENGTSFHNRMEAIFEDMGIMIAPELSLKSPELCISGRSDAIIWNPFRKDGDPDGDIITLENPAGELIYKGPENYVCLVEFKSIKEKAFYKLRKSKPKDAHEDQLQLYFHLTGIKTGIVYYENKNTQMPVEYHIQADPERIKAVTDRIARLIDMAKRGEIPEPELTPADVFMQYSDYKDMTYPNTNPVAYEMLFNDDDDDEEFPF